MAALSPNPRPNARRNSGGRRLSGAPKWEDAENFFDENDDENERRQAAEQAEEQRRMQKAKSPFKETPGHKRRVQEYSDWMQMANENRVTEKNSWAVGIIDHMHKDHMHMQDGQPDFLKAATTLEAGTKIFSLRVDSVATQANKLVSGLNRGGREPDDEEDCADAAEGAADGETGGTDSKTPKKVSKKAAAAAAAVAAGTAHLEENVSNLNLKKLEVSFDVDPLFHRTSAKFDEGGAKGLLLSNLSVGVGTALVFDSSDNGRADEAASAAPPPPPIPLGSISSLLPQGSLRVARAFSEFWASVRPDGPAPSGDADDEDEEEEEEEEEEEPVIHSPRLIESGPPPDLEQDGCDGYDAGGGFGGDESDEEDAAVAAKEKALEAQMGVLEEDDGAAQAVCTLDDMLEGASVDGTREVLAPIVADGPGPALSAHAEKMLAIGEGWAGIWKWKFRGGGTSSATAGRAGAAEAKKRVAKAAYIIDFSRSAETAAEVEGAELDKKGTTLLTAAAKAKAKRADTTLPHDFHCSIDALDHLFDKPAFRITYQRRRMALADPSAAGAPCAPTDTAERSGEKPFEAFEIDDEERYEDELQGFEGGDESDVDVEPVAESAEEGGSAPAGEGSIEEGRSFAYVPEPDKVDKVSIAYAKRAKTVDIAALKEDVWAILKQMTANGKGGKPVAFQAVIDRLHERMPPAKLAEVSISYCFYCVLHLANEKGLEIIGGDELTSLSLRMPAK